MALLGKIAKVAYKMTPKRKAALAKAVAASAKKRAKKAGTKVVTKTATKTVAKKSKVKVAARTVKRAAKTTARKTKSVTKKVLRTRAGIAGAIVGTSAGVAKATDKRANSKTNKSALIARTNQVSKGVKNLGVKAVTDTFSVYKNLGKAAIGKQTKTQAAAAIGADMVKSNLKLTNQIAQGQLNVKRARKNKIQRKKS